MKYLVKFIKLPLRIKIIFTEAYILLGYSRLIILLFQFKHIAKRLGDYNKESEFVNERVDISKIQRVTLAIRVISAHTFWRNNCLVQAYAGKLMLNRRNLSNTLYIGVGKDEEGKMIAHAWLRCGSTFVTGGNGEKFTITGKFTS